MILLQYFLLNVKTVHILNVIKYLEQFILYFKNTKLGPKKDRYQDYCVLFRADKSQYDSRQFGDLIQSRKIHGPTAH